MNKIDTAELGRFLDTLVDDGVRAMRVTAEASQIMYHVAARNELILQGAARIAELQGYGAAPQPLQAQPGPAQHDLPPPDYQAQHGPNGTYYSRQPDEDILKKAMDAVQRSDAQAVHEGLAHVAAQYQPEPAPTPPNYGQVRGGYQPPPRAPNPSYHGGRR